MRPRWIAVLFIITVILLVLIMPVSAGMQTIWVDPVHGDDNHGGSSPSDALATLSAGWGLIPKNTTLAHGYRILLLPGHYPEPAIPGYLELAYGTEKNPVIIEAANGSHTAILHGWLNIAQCSHLSLINLDIITDPGYGGGGNVVHLDGCDHIILKGCTLNGYDGTTRQPQETFKANQVTNLTVEDCDISGAFWYALDYVAVHNATITGSKVHDAGEFCLLLKGGSSDLWVERNEIYRCDTGGFSAGSGTGFNWMVSPYLHYELYTTKFVNNIIHDTGVVGISANGGYNVLIAYNTLYRTGHDNHLVEVMHGRRGCDGDTAACERNRLSGGWGNAGAEGEYIPSANVYVYNNVMYNPPGYVSQWEQMAVQGAVTPPSNSNVPLPDVVDRDLQIRGNMIWNGPPDLTLKGGDGCGPENLVCNETQILRYNTINQLEPELISPEHGDFTPSGNSTILYSPAYAIPPFPGNDRPSPPLAPQGDLNNLVTRDYFGAPRGKVSFAGAILPVSSPVAGFTATPRSGTAPLTVRFTDTSTKSPASWKWTFGDGSPVNATVKNPVHTYAKAGTYTVSLKATNAYGNTTVTKAAYISVTGKASQVGVFRPSTHMFYLRNGTRNTTVNYGSGTDIPITGDWNGDGLWNVGVFRPSTHMFYLRNGTRNTTVNYGSGTDIPITGDWNGDGIWDVGVFRNSTHMFYLRNGTRNTTINYGSGTDIPITGDWNGDGMGEVGVFRPSTRVFYLRNGTKNTTVNYGSGTDIPITGDWNGDGIWDIGVFRPSIHKFYLRNSSVNTTINYGLDTDLPVTGKWS